MRVERGWRQSDLARRSGVGQATISRIERGTRDVSLDRLATSRQLESIESTDDGAQATRSSAQLATLALHESGGPAVPRLARVDHGARGLVLRSTENGASSTSLPGIRAVRALLVIELKTDIADVNEVVGTIGRKRRLAWTGQRSEGGCGRGERLALAHRRRQSDEPAPRRRPRGDAPRGVPDGRSIDRGWLAIRRDRSPRSRCGQIFTRNVSGPILGPVRRVGTSRIELSGRPPTGLRGGAWNERLAWFPRCEFVQAAEPALAVAEADRQSGPAVGAGARSEPAASAAGPRRCERHSTAAAAMAVRSRQALSSSS